MQLKVARLKVIIALIPNFITIIIILCIMMVTFLRWENCMQLCRLRKDWLEALPGLLPPSSKLPRLSRKMRVRLREEMVMVTYTRLM